MEKLSLCKLTTKCGTRLCDLSFLGQDLTFSFSQVVSFFWARFVKVFFQVASGGEEGQPPAGDMRKLVSFFSADVKL